MKHTQEKLKAWFKRNSISETKQERDELLEALKLIQERLSPAYDYYKRGEAFHITLLGGSLSIAEEAIEKAEGK